MAEKDPIAAFFAELVERGPERRVGNAKGTVRFEVVNGTRTERWALVINQGRLTVSRGDVDAELVIRGSRSLLEQILRGRVNAMAAVLRQELVVEGNSELLVLLQRLFPRPLGVRPTSSQAGYARRQT